MNIFKGFISGMKGLWTKVGGESFTSWMTGGIGKRTRKGLLKEYRNIVYSCINAIAEDVGKYDPIFQTRDGRTREKKPIKNHPFERILENPNPDMTQFELFEYTESYLLLAGEAFWYLNLGKESRKPKEIYMLRPDKMSLAIDEDTGKVSGYVLRRDDGSEIPLELDEVIHHKTFNPINPYRGLGTVEAGLLYIETDTHTAQFQNNFLKNQATPSGVLSLKGNITRTAFKKVKKLWKEKQAGLENVGKTLFIRGTEAKFEKIGLSISDIEMDKLTELSEKRVRKMFRVPKAILGEVDSSGLGRSNVETVEYIFAKRVIEPELQKLDDTIRKAVRQYYKSPNLYIDHVSQVPEDKEALIQEYEKGVDKWITKNEIRKAQNLEELAGGDNLYISFSEIPINRQNSEEKGLGHIKVTKTIPKHEHKEKTKKEEEDPNMGNFYTTSSKLEFLTSNEYEVQFAELLEAQKKDVLDIVVGLGTKKGLKTKGSVSFDGVNFDMGFTREEVSLTLLETLLQALFKSGESAVELLNVPDIEFLVSQATRNSIFEATDRLMRSFNEETALKLQKQISAGVANSETIEQLTERVVSIYEEAEGYRARRIANTEAHRAVNEGVALGYQQSGVKKMTWVSFEPSCEFCKEMHGKTVSIGESFVPNGGSITGVDGGEMVINYTDVKYADLHPNCDCRLKPELN